MRYRSKYSRPSRPRDSLQAVHHTAGSCQEMVSRCGSLGSGAVTPRLASKRRPQPGLPRHPSRGAAPALAPACSLHPFGRVVGVVQLGSDPQLCWQVRRPGGRSKERLVRDGADAGRSLAAPSQCGHPAGARSSHASCSALQCRHPAATPSPHVAITPSCHSQQLRHTLTPHGAIG